jgi:hypothetical protein
MKLYVVLVFILFAQASFGEVMGLTFATWRGCSNKSCYSLDIEKGGVSSFIPKNLFVKGMRLNLFKKSDRKTPYLELIADHGFWIEDEKKWVLIKAHTPDSMRLRDYYFIADKMQLAEAKP